MAGIYRKYIHPRFNTLNIALYSGLYTPEVTINISAESDIELDLALPEEQIVVAASMASVLTGVLTATPEIVIPVVADAVKLYHTLALPEVSIPIVADNNIQLSLALPESTIPVVADLGAVGEIRNLVMPEVEIVVGASASDGFQRTVTADLELPSLGLSAYGSSGIEFELPSLALDIEGNTEKLANIKAAIPMLSMSATSGVYIDAELPAISIEVAATSQVLAQIAASLPMASIQVTTVGNRFGDIVASLPILHMETSTIGGAAASLSSNLPMPFIDIETLTGTVGDMALSIPMLRSRISSVPDDVLEASIPFLTMSMAGQQAGDNDFSMDIPALMASIHTEDIPDGALRYVRGDVR